MNEVVLIPALIPFTFHSYAGSVPPFAGIAVKMTEVPAQTGLTLGAIVKLTGKTGFTVTDVLVSEAHPFLSVTVTV